MKKYNIAVSVILILMSAGILLLAKDYGDAVDGTAMGAGVWPSLLAVVLIILCVILILQSLFKKQAMEGDDAAAAPQFRTPGMKRVCIMALIMAVFCILLKLLGFYPAIVFLMPAVMVLLGERSIPMMVALTAGTLVFVHIVFVVLIGLKLPSGMLF